MEEEYADARQWTVADLIAELQKYPADRRVVVSGYEGGFDDICIENKVLWDFKDVGTYDKPRRGHDEFLALILARYEGCGCYGRYEDSVGDDL